MNKVWEVNMCIRGSCVFELLRNDCSLQLVPTFTVHANFERAKPHMTRSFVKEVTVWYEYNPGPIVSLLTGASTPLYQ